jgi:hypothetical protein
MLASKHTDPVKDKSPTSLSGKWGLHYILTWGLRVSCLLDLRAVSGSICDTPTTAKTVKAEYKNEQAKAKNLNE